jgi:iron(III) transport system ATP-binding protein
VVGVALENLQKSFEGYTVIKNLNMNIRQGEFFTILGPSGCGKTTTLRMVAGFSFPTSGKILFDDRDVTYLNPSKRNTGMVFQNYALFPHMTIGENVAFGLKARKQDKADIQKKVAKMLEAVHLGGYANRRVNQISGGQQQRVALARALVIEPDILLLDEPLSNLDAKLREETRTEIRRLQLELGITTIYVTHDQAEAMAISDKIMIMSTGICQQAADPWTTYNKPANKFVATFIGKNNILSASVHSIEGQKVTVETDTGTILTGFAENKGESCVLEPGKKIAVAIRPESFRLTGDRNGENTISGVIELTEYTGANIDYFVKAEGHSLYMTFFNLGTKLMGKGELITVQVPPSHVYFLGEE